MCVLTRDEILRELKSGRLKIEPLLLDQVGPASIDLHLGEEVRELAPHENGPIHVRDDESSVPATHVVRLSEPYLLAPGQTVLAATLERVTLPPNLCAWIEGRSHVARLGLAVHVTSGFVQPGVSNHQVLEMSNVSTLPLAIHPRTRICQIVLERTEGEAVYRGRFAHQVSP
jgi:dCTP deaminase